MSLSPRNDQQTTYGNYNVYGNDIGLEAAPIQKATPAPRPVVAKERTSETSKKTAERDELLKLYYERDKEFEAAKGKRTLLTILLFTAAYFLIFFAIGRPMNLKGIAVFLLISLILSVVHFWIHLTIFGYLSVKGSEETEILERIRKRIMDLDKQ